MEGVRDTDGGRSGKGRGSRDEVGVRIWMDRKPAQQDAADFQPKLYLLCSFFPMARWRSLMGLSQPKLCLVCSVCLTAHGLAYPALSQPKLSAFQFLPEGRAHWPCLALANQSYTCSAVWPFVLPVAQQRRSW